MSEPRRKVERIRNDIRGEATRIELLEAAEELFAERGIENVSLRQIGSAIGSENNGVVSYYFGTKAGLLRAIYEYRIPELEGKRAQLLCLADEMGMGHDTVVLLFIMWSPIFEQRNHNGKRSYAGFLASVAHSSDISLPSLSRSYPVTRELADRLRSNAQVPEIQFWKRMRMISMMMIAAIQDAAELERKGSKHTQIDEVFLDALQLAAVALTSSQRRADSLRRYVDAAKKARATSSGANSPASSASRRPRKLRSQ